MLYPVRRDLAEMLALVEPEFPRDLAGSDAFERFRGVAHAVTDLTSHVSIECRLGRTRKKPRDLLLSVLSYDGGRERLVQLTQTQRSSRSRSTLDLGSLRPLVAAWSDPASPLYDLLRVAWLELDEFVLDAQRPVPPMTFICPEPAYPSLAGLVPPDRRANMEVIVHALPLLPGVTSTDDLLAPILRVIQCLPRTAYLLHLAYLGSRAQHRVRLVVAMEVAAMESFLQQQSWPGDVGRLRTLLGTVPPFGPVASLHIDLAPDGLQHRIGLEYFSYASPRKAAVWQMLFDQMQAARLLTAGQRLALEDWGGRRFITHPTAWYWLFTGVQVKLSIEPGRRGFVSKGYLGFAPRFMPI